MNFRLEPIRPKKVRKKHEGKNKVQVYAGVNQKTCKTADSTRKLPDCATKQAKHKQTSESPTMSLSRKKFQLHHTEKKTSPIETRNLDH